VTSAQIDSALKSKEDQMKQLEQKKEADIEAAQEVNVPPFLP
jgi:hypothetical protein